MLVSYSILVLKGLNLPSYYWQETFRLRATNQPAAEYMYNGFVPNHSFQISQPSVS